MRLLLVLLGLTAGPLSAQRVVHVVVALCDNQYQGIVKVPAGIGNGQKPGTNLYWGCGYGVRTHFDRASEWTRVPCGPAPNAYILDRAVWKHRDSAVYIVADAYDGRYIRETTVDFFRYASGADPQRVQLSNGHSVHAGGASDLVAYIGHDGLMEFTIDEDPPAQRTGVDAIMLACISKHYFAPHLRRTGANPLLWTTGLMAPEAYTLKAALDGWVAHEPAEAIRERAAQAYHTYQKCGSSGARRLLVTGW